MFVVAPIYSNHCHSGGFPSSMDLNLGEMTHGKPSFSVGKNTTIDCNVLLFSGE